VERSRYFSEEYSGLGPNLVLMEAWSSTWVPVTQPPKTALPEDLIFRHSGGRFQRSHAVVAGSDG
jgi:hypothetical protein